MVNREEAGFEEQGIYCGNCSFAKKVGEVLICQRISDDVTSSNPNGIRVWCYSGCHLFQAASVTAPVSNGVYKERSPLVSSSTPSETSSANPSASSPVKGIPLSSVYSPAPKYDHSKKSDPLSDSSCGMIRSLGEDEVPVIGKDGLSVTKVPTPFSGLDSAFIPDPVVEGSSVNSSPVVSSPVESVPSEGTSSEGRVIFPADSWVVRPAGPVPKGRVIVKPKGRQLIRRVRVSFNGEEI